MTVTPAGDTATYEGASGALREAMGVVVLSGGGEGGDGLTDEQLRASPVPVSIPAAVTVSGIAGAGSTGTGAPSAAAYADNTGAANGTVIALLKGIYVQNEAIRALLETIADNTTPAE